MITIDSCGTVHYIWLYQGRKSSLSTLIFEVDISLAVNHNYLEQAMVNFNPMVWVILSVDNLTY